MSHFAVWNSSSEFMGSGEARHRWGLLIKFLHFAVIFMTLKSDIAKDIAQKEYTLTKIFSVHTFSDGVPVLLERKAILIPQSCEHLGYLEFLHWNYIQSQFTNHASISVSLHIFTSFS